MARPRVSGYPFSAIVGQETLKTTLLINAVDPRVGGVLVRGERGTAKSTAVRALGGLMPQIETFTACRLGCDPNSRDSWCDECLDPDAHPHEIDTRPAPFVDLPLSATEDRLVGSMDLERVLATGVHAFQPGLLAAANRGILYVDEVNLLDDHLVDTLLDVAASGINVIEREGLSVSHHSRFVLVGTMNPEEGELRPQLLDRFGLCADVSAIRDPVARVDIMRRRERFDNDPAAFATTFEQAEADLRASIDSARRSVVRVELADAVLEQIARLTIAADVDGHRADQVIARASTALAALQGDDSVTASHVARVAPLALAHRVRTSPLQDSLDATRAIACLVAQSLGASSEGEEPTEPQVAPTDGVKAAVMAAEPTPEANASPAGSALSDKVRERVRRSSAGSTATTRTTDGRGRFVRADDQRPQSPVEVAVDATVRAAAVRQGTAHSGDLAIDVQPEDLRRAVRSRRSGATIVFAVDASGSMSALNRMEAAKAAVLSLLTDAYQRRDRVGLVSFRGDRATTLLAPTASVELARLRLRNLDIGGSTPLAAGMLAALDLLNAERRRDPDAIPWLVLVTDGRANVGIEGGIGSEDARAAAARVRAAGVRVMLLDTATGGSGAAREIASLSGADYEILNSTDSTAVFDIVQRRVGSQLRQ